MQLVVDECDEVSFHGGWFVYGLVGWGIIRSCQLGLGEGVKVQAGGDEVFLF